MASFNKVMLMGNLTRDPEVRVTPSGLSICKLSIAVNRVFNSKDGERKEEVTYIDVDAFGNQADVIGKYLTKGRPIFVEGRLKLDQWETNGEKRSKLSVVLESFQFIDSGNRGGSDSGDYEKSSPPPRASRSQSAPKQEDNIDDDVPF